MFTACALWINLFIAIALIWHICYTEGEDLADGHKIATGVPPMCFGIVSIIA